MVNNPHNFVANGLVVHNSQGAKDIAIITRTNLITELHLLNPHGLTMIS